MREEVAFLSLCDFFAQTAENEKLFVFLRQPQTGSSHQITSVCVYVCSKCLQFCIHFVFLFPFSTSDYYILMPFGEHGNCASTHTHTHDRSGNSSNNNSRVYRFLFRLDSRQVSRLLANYLFRSRTMHNFYLTDTVTIWRWQQWRRRRRRLLHCTRSLLPLPPLPLYDVVCALNYRAAQFVIQ